jgi:hypothetical protein
VQMEHIDDDVAAPPSAGNLSPRGHSSLAIQPPLWESLTEGRTRRHIV